ncbi:hypothetical protein K7957_13320 [Sphingomonas yunnanensis]|uniref:hypothetical protein n=1 Tax=Sphingomonas yunnanensis TaxID=310400 RepID=UPI001CA7B2FB|nr:hypothetical protein [Sphingomonas yunnanensis]MBY9063918.1 hypothetical protein [Sphingomonas yunnanensis]
MARKLKVFRTPAGFHDAYVAAPSRKAALAAWGADADLFARGVAEEVTDAALMEEPLACPGEVVRRSRGSAAEQLAALPPDRPKRARTAAEEEVPRRKATARAKVAKEPPAPRPSRAELEAAEAALEQEDARRRDEEKALAERQAALDRQRREAGRRHERERARLDDARVRAAEAYAASVEKWRR